MYIIGIAGGTASGKSTFAEKLLLSFADKQPALLSLDSYYHSQDHLPEDQRAYTNYDHPNSFDIQRLLQDINCLKLGQKIESPIYDFATHTRSPLTKVIQPTSLLIIEGILTLQYLELREQLDWKIFFSTPDSIRLERRINRDITERGRTRADVIRQWKETVNPMHHQFCEPTKIYADQIIAGESNTETDLKNFILGKLA